MNWHDWLNVGAITLSLAALLMSVAVMNAHRRRERGFPMPPVMHVQLTPEQMARVNRIGPVLDDGRAVHHSPSEPLDALRRADAEGTVLELLREGRTRSADGHVVHHSREHEHTLADEISVRAWHEREMRAELEKRNPVMVIDDGSMQHRAYDMETQIREDAAELIRNAPERTIVQTYADLLNRLDTRREPPDFIGPGVRELGLTDVQGTPALQSGPKHAIADPLRDKHIRVTGEPTHGVGARGPGQKFPEDES